MYIRRVARYWTVIGLAATGALVLSQLSNLRGSAQTGTTGGAAPAVVPVLIELFSSEGCSSCPPADEYLIALDRQPRIENAAVIALEEHVDYWDDIGWRDPFSSPQFSARQRQYARVLPDDRVFTPELVVDGRWTLTQRTAAATRALLRQAAAEPKARVALRCERSRLTFDIDNVPNVPPGDSAEIWLAIAQVGLSSQVDRGENSGRVLSHGPIVRKLSRIARMPGSSFHGTTSCALEPAWKPNATRFVVFVQLAQSRRIVGAGVL